MATPMDTEMPRPDGRSPNELRTLVSSRALLHRAHGSARWSQDNTIVLAAVYGPKGGAAGKMENPEKATLEVIWKPKTGQAGKAEKECEMIVKKTLEYIFLSTMHPNTITSVILQVVNDDGALLACAVNAACVALMDAGIASRNVIAAVCCGVRDNGEVILDPTKLEEQKVQAHVCLIFPCRPLTVLSEGLPTVDSEPLEHGIISSVTRGAMMVDNYLDCLERSRAASIKISDFIRSSIEKGQRANDLATSS
ncbi:exosome complex exonuclease RRP46 homolog [Cryptomeria japonica]|uniref:exosome complex exonuclease RRP46 homolog n=1 Tax=Cryptomeria japonica TaxID=3369 RepID=UPI0025ACC786|nr:exosome complex exonuclease RRP46 homolog [Cryptomeria japonica]